MALVASRPAALRLALDLQAARLVGQAFRPMASLRLAPDLQAARLVEPSDSGAPELRLAPDLQAARLDNGLKPGAAGLFSFQRKQKRSLPPQNKAS